MIQLLDDVCQEDQNNTCIGLELGDDWMQQESDE